MSWIRNIFSRHGANGHEFVDLGLSVCWATMNMGARASYECGKAYTWGAIRQSGDYPRFRYCECCIDKYTKYVTDSLYGKVDYLTTLLPRDDVAHKNADEWKDFKNILPISAKK